MNRILIFHYHDTAGNEKRMAPAYYMDAEYDKVAVRIYAETAPLRDAIFNIYNDGVSIFSNRTSRAWDISTGEEITGAADTNVCLAAGDNSDEMADDFNNITIEEGSFVYCNLIDTGGGKNFTVQLELSPLSEGESGED